MSSAAVLISSWIAAQPTPGAIEPPVLETAVQAAYPSDVTGARSSTVTLALEIQVDGAVGKVEVVESGGPEFDREAVAAGRSLRFRPATIDGEPVAVRILYRYAFELRVEPPPIPSINLTGAVYLSETREPLEGVTVEIVDLLTSTVTVSSTVTSSDGRFAFSGVPPGHHELRFARPGLVTLNVEQAVVPGEVSDGRVAMERIVESSIDEEEVVRAPRVRREIAETRIVASEARRVPGTQGDTVKVVETMGGVGRAAAGSGDVVVWGASPSDTRSYVDGVLVPRLFHLGGSRSVVASELVSSVELVPGGFGAAYGRAIGGLIRVDTVGPIEESGLHGHLTADLIDASLGARGRLADAWSLSAGVRKSLLAQTFGMFVDDRQRELIPIPSYWDYQTKLAYSSGADRLGFLIFGSEDAVTRETQSADPTTRTSDRTRLGFHRIGARFERLAGDGSSLEVVSWAGVDRNEKRSTFGGVPAALDETAWRFGLSGAERRRVASFLTLVAGLDLEGNHSSLERTGALTLPPREGDVVAFGLGPGDRTNDDAWAVTIGSAAAHATAELALFAERLTIEPGLRFELTVLDGDRVFPARGREAAIGYTNLDAVFDPRLKIGWRALDVLSFHAAGGRYHQSPSPADLSPVFGSPVLGQISGIHSVLGARLEPLESTSIEVTGFFVALSDMPVRSRLPTPPRAAALTSTGEGRNYGAQIVVRAEIIEGLSGWITYSLTRAERRDSSESAWRLFDADQAHNLSLVATWRIGAGFDVGARFRYATGFPRTPVIGAYYDGRSGTFDPIYGDHNSVRLPAFIDLSLRVAYSYDFGWGELEAFLDVQNLTNRRNAEEIAYTSDFSRSELISGTPLLPVFGARLEI